MIFVLSLDLHAFSAFATWPHHYPILCGLNILYILLFKLAVSSLCRVDVQLCVRMNLFISDCML